MVKQYTVKLTVFDTKEKILEIHSYKLFNVEFNKVVKEIEIITQKYQSKGVNVEFNTSIIPII